MSIEKLNHYSMTSPSSVYDEEALTALELAGRTATKVNESVVAFNELEAKTNNHLEAQDREIAERTEAQDTLIDTMNNVTMPAKVTSEVQKKIDDGSFDQSINSYIGNLEGRVDNLLSSVPEGGTTMDAEIIDLRVGAKGEKYKNAGASVRKVQSDLSEIYTADERNLFNKGIYTPNYYYRNDGMAPSDNYGFFELDVEIGKTYIFGQVARFIVTKENGTTKQFLERVQTFTAEGSKAFVSMDYAYREFWVMCEDSFDPVLIKPFNQRFFTGKLEDIVNKVDATNDYTSKAFMKNNNMLFGTEYKEGSLWQGALNADPNYNVFLNIPVKEGVNYVIEPKARLLFLSKEENGSFEVEYLHDSAGYTSYTPIKDGFLQMTMYAQHDPSTYAFYEEGTDNILPFNKVVLSDAVELPTAITENVGDSLYGKKWAVCGDSFTHGSKPGTLTDGKYKGKNKTYQYFIGNRTGIEVLPDFFRGGRTLAYPADGTFSNSLTCPTVAWYYQNIPEDVDYITIYLGINDSHHESGTSGTDGEDVTGAIPLGTINDTTTATYYGAWNVVLSWLIENRPFAHIGIIVSNGCDRVAYRTAQIEIAKKFGIPFIDMNGDDRTPVMIRSLNPDISDAVKAKVNKKQAVDYDGTKTGNVDWHPNDDAHEYESYFIENFLRSI